MIPNAWKASGIEEAIARCWRPELNAFQDNDPLMSTAQPKSESNITINLEISKEVRQVPSYGPCESDVDSDHKNDEVFELERNSTHGFANPSGE